MLGITAAQAITIEWTPTNNGGANYDYQVDLSQADTTRAINASLTLNTTSGDPAKNNLFWDISFNGYDESKNSIQFRRDSNGNGELRLIDTNGTVAGSVTMTNPFATNSVNYTLSFDYCIATNTLNNITFDGVTYTNVLTATSMTYAQDGIYYSDVMNGGKFHITNVSIEQANVPEPTVLALLALGVAGIALKRKVA